MIEKKIMNRRITNNNYVRCSNLEVSNLYNGQKKQGGDMKIKRMRQYKIKDDRD